MIDMLTGLNLPHEAERQSAFIIIRRILGTPWWFIGGFDKMEGDEALKLAQDVEEDYWHLHSIL